MTPSADNASIRPARRSVKDYAGVSLRGIAMGAADVVPGVSGGTIAIISGIYEELIDSIRSINPAAMKLLLSEGVASFWRFINGTFLVALVIGIGISIFSLAKFISGLLDTQPILVWSFFFGLVIASSIFVGQRITDWTAAKLLAFALGAVASYMITVVSPAQPNTDYWFVFASGAIAICAMILPGISGSFILVLLGMYRFVLEAVSELKFAVILTFVAGAGIGLMGFSNLLSWLLHKYHDLTIAALVGVMIGSLNKVWPWKQVLAWQIDRHGDMVPSREANVLPHIYAQLPPTEVPGASTDPHILVAAALAVCGFLAVAAFELLTRPKTH